VGFTFGRVYNAYYQIVFFGLGRWMELELTGKRARIVKEIEAEYGRSIEEILLEKIEKLHGLFFSQASSHTHLRSDAKHRP